MALGSKDLAPAKLRELGDDELVGQLKEAKQELFNLRFQSATGQLENNSRLRAVRKDIARIYTEMRERELGIGRATESATDEKVS
ncbi:50S ribosomal protein L29 [Yimella sp. cx-51]|uniref:50S ribosomal protein L29 n=1 Tax=Yimella sp. cx-51 TaxID=2770551 RepID=UPI00165E7A4B|nr:50S ribosomal protein L29 [Yimella sp. cx-51]MBC9955912.1 50S ribosomal protein L29 [Yimella sp. cx-51]MBD2758079.1 50S ribosomal protein L29 [Yimella sp. cx-573]QTH37545.1 50S ribosomal protein L29 [Yimella sp. cx-51]